MFGRKYLTELNLYFPYHYIFKSASHTLQKPQTKDNGSCSYISFFYPKKGRLHTSFSIMIYFQKRTKKYK